MPIFKQIAFILSVVVLSLLVGYAATRAWTDPVEAPPGSNIPTPINIGSNAQTKQGVLQVNADFTANRLIDTSDSSYYIDPANTSYSALFAGSVGIGTTAPSEKLEVAGNVRLYKSGAFPSVSVADAWGVEKVRIHTNGYSWFNGGNVGIGTTAPQTKLDVAGAIKIGTQATCNSNTEGAIRYNSDTKKFEGCDGQYWLPVTTDACGGITSVNFTYKGSSVNYGTVTSSGRCWLDRNLGASRVATAFNDSLAYGDLFQWGRLDDGHQTRTSGTTGTLSSSDNPGHSNFIYAGTTSPYDWRSPQNNNLWQGVSGINNPCPSGWRLPTIAEWVVEYGTWSSQNYYGAFASPLKLTAGGYRHYTAGAIGAVGEYTGYWSGTISGTNAYPLLATVSNIVGGSWQRASGFSVRCVLN